MAMSDIRKVCEETEVLRLPAICANWPTCRAKLETEHIHKSRLFDASPGKYNVKALGYFCDCEPKR